MTYRPRARHGGTFGARAATARGRVLARSMPDVAPATGAPAPASLATNVDRAGAPPAPPQLSAEEKEWLEQGHKLARQIMSCAEETVGKARKEPSAARDARGALRLDPAVAARLDRARAACSAPSKRVATLLCMGACRASAASIASPA